MHAHFRTTIYISLPANNSYAAASELLVRFNQSEPFTPPQATSRTSITTVCPAFNRPGRYTGQILSGRTGSLVAEFRFTYEWPRSEVFPAKIPMSGSTITLEVCVNDCGVRACVAYVFISVIYAWAGAV